MPLILFEEGEEFFKRVVRDFNSIPVKLFNLMLLEYTPVKIRNFSQQVFESFRSILILLSETFKK